MNLLNENHIASVYWLAEAYLSTNQRLINKICKTTQYIQDNGYHRYMHIRNVITRLSATGKCILCISSGTTPTHCGCRECIHILSDLSCVVPIQNLCSIKPDNTPKNKAGDKLFIEKMHARGMYLYSLLDLYYKQLEVTSVPTT